MDPSSARWISLDLNSFVQEIGDDGSFVVEEESTMTERFGLKCGEEEEEEEDDDDDDDE